MRHAIDLNNCSNLLLLGLNEDDKALLSPFLIRKRLHPGMYLERRDCPIKSVHFIESGVVSSIVTISKVEQSEVMVVGYEGMTGIEIVLGRLTCITDYYVQVGGYSLCISPSDLKRLIVLSTSMCERFIQYTQCLLVQLTQTAHVNLKANVQRRLARWLLMYQDRVLNRELPLTHESISLMLGVRRASVTVALHHLEGNGWISAKRRCVTIRDRRAMEEFCGGIYGAAESRYSAPCADMSGADYLSSPSLETS